MTKPKSKQVSKSGSDFWNRANLYNLIALFIVTAAATVIATIITGLVPAERWGALVGFKPSNIHVYREVVYAKILYFRDRSAGEEPFRVGNAITANKTGKVASGVPLYDEGFYLKAYYLAPHADTSLRLAVQSSGRVGITPIIPSEISMDPKDEKRYVDGGEHSADYELPIDEMTYILESIHYYNGYQFDDSVPDSLIYQSDGGTQVLYPTDTLVLVMDFSSVDFKSLIVDTPKVVLRQKLQGQSIVSPWPSIYDASSGILTCKITNPPVGSLVLCDWTWSTEATVKEKAKKLTAPYSH